MSSLSLPLLCLLSSSWAYTVEDVRYGLTPTPVRTNNYPSRPAETGEFELLMPNAKPQVAETYLCTTIRLDENNTYYVTGFNPKAEMGTAHHMLLFGCEVRTGGGDGGDRVG